jgi:hypothetical protein
MQIKVNEDAKSVLEFMQANVPTERLVGVADVLPQMARLLWAKYPQEPCVGISLVGNGITSDSLPSASESSPGPSCVGGGSVVGADNP